MDLGPIFNDVEQGLETEGFSGFCHIGHRYLDKVTLTGSKWDWAVVGSRESSPTGKQTTE